MRLEKAAQAHLKRQKPTFIPRSTGICELTPAANQLSKLSRTTNKTMTPVMKSLSWLLFRQSFGS